MQWFWKTKPYVCKYIHCKKFGVFLKKEKKDKRNKLIKLCFKAKIQNKTEIVYSFEYILYLTIYSTSATVDTCK